jgi:hypothetical protein
MKLGTENKKSLIALAVLAPIMLGVMYWAFAPDTPKRVTPVAAVPAADGSDTPTASDTPPAVAPEKSSGPDISRAPGEVRRTASRSKAGEFHPAVIPKKKEDRQRIIQDVDPTIRFDLLAKVMKVPPAGGERDLFQILKGPPVKDTPGLKGPEPLVARVYGPRAPGPPPPPPGPPPEKPPAVIPFKFYGVSSVHPDGTRTAYFIIPNPDGDEILMANEGQVLKNRFRIVQISVDKVLVEDTQDKRRQPLNMEKEATQ